MNALMRRLGLRKPVILAPMAGGITTPPLVAAVSAAGGLGSLGAAYLSPEQIRETGAAVRHLTDRPFAIGLFAPQPLPSITPEQLAVATTELAPLHAELALPPPALPAHIQENFEAQFEAVLDVHPAVFSFAFGLLDHWVLREVKGRGIQTIGTATSVQEAQILEAAGVDAVVLQGGAAGGHRGGWLTDPLAGTPELVRQAVSAVHIPVIAAGGLMTQEDVRAVLDAGAALAQCGTVFLRAEEAGTNPAYRDALARARPGDTVITRHYSGKPARGIRTAFTQGNLSPLPYPYQNALTRELRAAATRQGRTDFMSLWAGEAAWKGADGSAADLLNMLWQE